MAYQMTLVGDRTRRRAEGAVALLTAVPRRTMAENFQ